MKVLATVANAWPTERHACLNHRHAELVHGFPVGCVLSGRARVQVIDVHAPVVVTGVQHPKITRVAIGTDPYFTGETVSPGAPGPVVVDRAAGVISARHHTSPTAQQTTFDGFVKGSLCRFWAQWCQLLALVLLGVVAVTQPLGPYRAVAQIE